ncbi:MAG: hypothetical protein ACJA0U_002744 [Salibacteraceae bacterium]|jgi:hypothetical protein
MDFKEYNHDNYLKIIVDEDGDSFDVFRNVIRFINENLKVEKSNFDNCYTENSIGFFQINGLKIYVEYSNWTGTLLKIQLPVGIEDKQLLYKVSEQILLGLE